MLTVDDPVQAALLADTQARQTALEPRSFIVEAPAGAGKTELLTQRFLRLLALVAHPEEVVALTFTNKAAAEMRERILGSLELAAGGEWPQAAHKQQTFRLAEAVLARDRAEAWGLLEHPGRLRVTTLDALCASLARQMPYLSRFGAQPRIVEPAEDLYRLAARRTLAMLEEDTGSGGLANVVAEALAFVHNDSPRLERLLVSMLGRRDQWLRHSARFGALLTADAALPEEGAEALATLRAEVEAGLYGLVARDMLGLDAAFPARLQALFMPPVRYAASQLPALDGLADWSAPLQGRPEDLPVWRLLAQACLTKDGLPRRRLTVREGFAATPEAKPFKEAMQAALDELQVWPEAVAALGRVADLPVPGLDDRQWAAVACFARLLHLAAGQLWLAFQERGEVDFIEMSARAQLALGDEEAPTDLAQALDYSIQHLLVDEFQDTSPVQVELLLRLTRGWTPSDGRTLFLVGDPMQSIYRFRKADVGLFLQVRAKGIGDVPLQPLRLLRNNRSDPAVVGWVNQVFPKVFPTVDRPEYGAVRYAPSAATRTAVADAAVRLHPVLVGGEDDAAAREADCILACIRAAQQEEPDGRIAVLVRARSHLDALVASLRRDAPTLRFQAVEVESLSGRQGVQDVLALCHALHQRADRVHWLAVLRAPWCGLTLADLHALVADDRVSTVWQLMQDAERLARLSADGQARLRHVRDILQLALAEAGRVDVRRWLEGVWLMLDGPACLESAAELADVDALLALLERLLGEGRFTPELLQQEAESLFAPADPLADARLQLMTVHKSKGLEFETVILPGLDRTLGQQDSPLLIWESVALDTLGEHLVVAPMPAKGEASEGPTPYGYLRQLEKERSAHEDERVLYVAVTRAIRRLDLIAVVQRKLDDSGETLRPPPAGTPLALLWAPLAEATCLAALAECAASPTAEALPEEPTFVPPLRRLAQLALPATLAALPVSEQAFDDEIWGVQETVTGQQRQAAQAVGILVHRCLELIARQGLAAWPLSRIETSRPAHLQWLQGQGLASATAEAAAMQVGLALQATLQSDAGRWLLAPHPEAQSEWALVSHAAIGGQHLHVIDRSFVCDGERWIVDYKTEQVELGADEAEFTRRAEAHLPQLARYATLLADQGLPCRLAVFFTVQGRLVSL